MIGCQFGIDIINIASSLGTQSFVRNYLPVHACSRPCERQRDGSGYPPHGLKMTRTNTVSIRSDTLATQNTSCRQLSANTPGRHPLKTRFHLAVPASGELQVCSFHAGRMPPYSHTRVFLLRLFDPSIWWQAATSVFATRQPLAFAASDACVTCAQ